MGSSLPKAFIYTHTRSQLHALPFPKGIQAELALGGTWLHTAARHGALPAGAEAPAQSLHLGGGGVQAGGNNHTSPTREGEDLRCSVGNLLKKTVQANRFGLRGRREPRCAPKKGIRSPPPKGNLIHARGGELSLTSSSSRSKHIY